CGGRSGRDTLPRSIPLGAEGFAQALLSIPGQTEVRLWAGLRWPWAPLEKGHSIPQCNIVGTATLCLCHVPGCEPPLLLRQVTLAQTAAGRARGMPVTSGRGLTPSPSVSRCRH